MMKGLAWLVGSYFVVTGLAFLAMPETLKRYVVFWSQGARLYLVGMGRVLCAAILFVAAPHARFPWVVAGGGFLNVILGIPYFIRSIERTRRVVSSWERRPPAAVRSLGIVSIIVGAALMFSV
jgi:uncharacterized protein YjeT (DUF2065 family)